jgi:molybdenum cofactor biosynthesis enzyme MoaA
MNVDEAARHLKVSASYLNKLRLTGGGPVYAKLGAKVVYDPDDLAKWVQSRKQTSTSDTTGEA